MNEKKRVLVAMSGGVDSSAAAALLVRQGYDCDGAMLKLYRGEDGRCCSADDAEDARQAAARLGMRQMPPRSVPPPVLGQQPAAHW